MAVVSCHSLTLSLSLSLSCCLLFVLFFMFNFPCHTVLNAPCQTCHHRSLSSRDQSRVIHARHTLYKQGWMPAADRAHRSCVHSFIITILSVFAMNTLLHIICPVSMCWIAVLYLSIYPSIYLSFYLSFYLSIYHPVYCLICRVKFGCKMYIKISYFINFYKLNQVSTLLRSSNAVTWWNDPQTH